MAGANQAGWWVKPQVERALRARSDMGTTFTPGVRGAAAPPVILSLFFFFLLFLLFNALAYRHAYLFFNYQEGVVATPPPEELTWSDKIQLAFRGVKIPKPKAHSHPGQRGMAYEPIVLPGRDGMELAGWYIPVEPSDTMVILFHGYNSEKSGLLPEAHLFHQMGFDVMMVDFSGAGESPGTRTSLGILEAEDVAAVYGHVRRAHPEKRVVLYGHSMGAAAVMRAMARHGVRPEAAVIEAVFDSLLQAIRFRFALLSAPSWPSAEFLLFWGSVQLRANGFAHQPVGYAGQIDTPVIMIHGKQDNRASWPGAEAVFRALKGEKVLLLIDNAGHVNPSATDPERWRAEVGAFIRRP